MSQKYVKAGHPGLGNEGSSQAYWGEPVAWVLRLSTVRFRITGSLDLETVLQEVANDAHLVQRNIDNGSPG